MIERWKKKLHVLDRYRKWQPITNMADASRTEKLASARKKVTNFSFYYLYYNPMLNLLIAAIYRIIKPHISVQYFIKCDFRSNTCHVGEEVK